MIGFNGENHWAKRGSILIATLLMLLIASVGIILCARTVLDHGQMFERKRDNSRAFYAAEAGVNLVMYWFSNPDDYEPDATLFAYNEVTESYEKLQDLLDDGPVVIDEDQLPTMIDSEGEQVGFCESLYLEAPAPEDPESSIARIIAVGRGRKEARRQVELLVAPNIPLSLESVSAALVSFSDVAFSGEAEVHWGSIWAKGDITIKKKQKYDDILSGKDNGGIFDQWFELRTEGRLSFSDVWNDENWNRPSAWYDANASLPVMAAGGDVQADYGNRMIQNDDGINFPEFDYDEIKALALEYGRYYSTDAAGNLYRDGIEDDDHRVDDFAEEFSVDPAAGSSELVFFDTIDGNPPAEDGSNLADFKVSGGNLHTKGFYYLCVNYDVTGIGSPPSFTAQSPGGDPVTLSKCMHDGLLYITGTLKALGNNQVFGSLIAEGGYAGGGTPDVFYNIELGNGIPITPGGGVKRVRWKNN